LARDAPRARSRFATFAHAISSTNPTAPSSTKRRVRTGPIAPSSSSATRAVRRAFDLGSFSRCRPAIARISALACSSVTPGLSRPTTWRNPFALSAAASGVSAIGIQTRTSSLERLNDAGITPTIVTGRPPSRTTRPTMRGSPLKRVVQSAWLITATWSRPGASSSGRNVRPSAARTPYVRK